jgi:uncharacterized iron-regulated protein
MKNPQLIGRPALTAACLALMLLAASSCVATMETKVGVAETACVNSGRWHDPATGQTLDARQVFVELAGKDIVLLGERHTSREDHLWQAQTIAGLHALKPNIVAGFEMFPRSVQPALDAWSNGELSRTEFLEQSRWSQVWGYGAEFYMPMFDHARLNRIPMVALNVDRALISKVGREGWASISEKDREGVSEPAAAPQAYRESLARVFLSKMQHSSAKPAGASVDDANALGTEAKLESIMASEPYGRFVQAQLTWDRAMAEGLASAKEDNPDALVVGVMGRGHIEYRHGVPHQLSALGFDNVAVLIPIDAGTECNEDTATLADAVFVVDPTASEAAKPAKPRLGVVIETTAKGVRILRVADDSVAAQAALAAGDIIVGAAGTPIKENADLLRIIERQAPGTWLPLSILRCDEDLDIVAKFPTSFESVQ